MPGQTPSDWPQEKAGFCLRMIPPQPPGWCKPLPTKRGGQECPPSVALPHWCHWDSLCLHLQLQVAQHQCVIHDALRGVKHVVQVRGKEEFDIGQWSKWSPEVTGTPWLGTWVYMEGGWGTFQLMSMSALYCMAKHAKPPSPPSFQFIEKVPHSVQAGLELTV